MKYIAKKFGSLLLTLLLVSFLSFFAFSVIPGDAAKSQLGTEATPERIEALQKEMGLDRPVLERYASWVTGLFSWRSRHLVFVLDAGRRTDPR